MCMYQWADGPSRIYPGVGPEVWARPIYTIRGKLAPFLMSQAGTQQTDARLDDPGGNATDRRKSRSKFTLAYARAHICLCPLSHVLGRAYAKVHSRMTCYPHVVGDWRYGTACGHAMLCGELHLEPWAQEALEEAAVIPQVPVVMWPKLGVIVVGGGATNVIWRVVAG